MSKRNAHGAGSLRQRKNGTWEARYTYVDELGVKKRGSVYAKTQGECQRKLTAALASVNAGERQTKPERQTLETWISTWLDVYCKHLKPMTVEDYKRKSDRYIIPTIGKAKIATLTPVQVQRFVNKLSEGYDDQKPLSPKSVKNIHGILHSALKQAVLAGIIRENPADNTRLPKVKKPELKPLMDDDVSRFLSAIKGARYERLYLLDLFTGLRQSELLGLQWEDVDFDAGKLTVRRQLQKQRNGQFVFIDTTKNGKSRVVPLAPSLLKVLREQKRQQTEWHLAAGELWNNPQNLVFTDEVGDHLTHRSVYHEFKKIVKAIGMPSTRFHDLRHSCAIMELQAGVSVKAVQEQLGHYSSAFTMDVYAAVSEIMQQDTKNKVETLITKASNG